MFQMASETEVYRKHIESLQMVSHLITHEGERFKVFRFLAIFLELRYNLFCLEGKCC